MPAGDRPGRHRAEQGIPEDHREEALVALPEQMAVHPADQFARCRPGPPDRVRRHGSSLFSSRRQASRNGPRSVDAAAETVDHHQKMQRKAQPAIGGCSNVSSRASGSNGRTTASSSPSQERRDTEGRSSTRPSQASQAPSRWIRRRQPENFSSARGQQQHQERHVSSWNPGQSVARPVESLAGIGLALRGDIAVALDAFRVIAGKAARNSRPARAVYCASVYGSVPPVRCQGRSRCTPRDRRSRKPRHARRGRDRRRTG